MNKAKLSATLRFRISLSVSKKRTRLSVLRIIFSETESRKLDVKKQFRRTIKNDGGMILHFLAQRIKGLKLAPILRQPPLPW